MKRTPNAAAIHAACAAVVLSLAMPAYDSHAAAAADATVQPATCDAVDREAVAQIFGAPVAGPDERSRSAGICFYPATPVVVDGSVSYAIVTPQRLAQRRAIFRAYALRCRGVDPRAPRYAQCLTFRALATARNPNEYYAARIGRHLDGGVASEPATPAPSMVAGATPAPAPLGDESETAGGTLVVRRGENVYEFVVRRNGDFDAERTLNLAKAVLAASS